MPYQSAIGLLPMEASQHGHGVDLLSDALGRDGAASRSRGSRIALFMIGYDITADQNMIDRKCCGESMKLFKTLALVMMQMKTLLLFLALSFAAAAQTLIGLPEYGITLSGSDKKLILENHSGKTIIATMVSEIHANGKRMDSSGYHLASIKDGGSLPISGATNERIPGYSDSPVVEIKLWAVVFADGELRGVDPYTGGASFQAGIEAKFQAINETGRLASAGDWLELNRRAELPGADFDNRFAKQYAQQLVAARNGPGGEPAALEIGKKFQGLPEHLWRAK
jgi:hypothetical protein